MFLHVLHSSKNLHLFYYLLLVRRVSFALKFSALTEIGMQGNEKSKPFPHLEFTPLFFYVSFWVGILWGNIETTG